jgi:hypothetical protein
MADFLSMSDADFLAQGPAKLVEAQAAAVSQEQPNVKADETVDVLNAEESVQPHAGDVPVVDGDPAEGNAEAETQGEGQSAESRQPGTNEADETDAREQTDADRQQPVEKPEVSTPVLPEDAHRIFESFRANGRDMKVRNVDEAIRLMQMGANYSQKRAADKKNLGYVKVLEQNNLLDHEKLAFAVDLLAGKPEAIGKLLKDSKVDVHDLDDDKVAAYRAESRAPSEASLDLEEVIAEAKSSKQFGRLVDEMKGWDQASQALVGNHPNSLLQLTEQMENGVYDKIMDEVNHRQMLGQLNGVPLMQAYNDIGRELAQAGAFNAKPAPKGPVTKLVTPGKKSPSSKTDEDRRRAAAPSTGASTASEVAQKPNFLAMSDEEFLKQAKR